MAPSAHNATLPATGSLSESMERVKWAGWILCGAIVLGSAGWLVRRVIANSEDIARTEERTELHFEQLRDGQLELKQDIRNLSDQVKGRSYVNR